MQSGNFDSLL